LESLDKLPFAVARSSRATLVEQVAEGLRRAIDSGFYKAGDVLPTTRDLATSLGVSRIVTRAAVRELAEAGLINPKPSVGSVVLGRSGKLWRGNVLFISRAKGWMYYVNVFTATL
jgi:GntR family transcriptional regulator/MocR family aminotransferase